MYWKTWHHTLRAGFMTSMSHTQVAVKASSASAVALLWRSSCSVAATALQNVLRAGRTPKPWGCSSCPRDTTWGPYLVLVVAEALVAEGAADLRA